MRTDIYMHKGIPDDQSPLSSESPQTNIAESQPMSLGGKVALGYGALAARQSFRMAVGQIKASGNENLAMAMQNTAKAIMDIGLIVGTGGKALIPMAISGGIEALGNHLDRERRNQETEINNRLRGVVVGFMQSQGGD